MATQERIYQLPAASAVTDTSQIPNEDTSLLNVTQRFTALQFYNYLLSKGLVIGPASSDDNALALFDGVSGKLIKQLDPGVQGQNLVLDNDGAPLYQFKNPVIIDTSEEITIGTQGGDKDYGLYRVLTGADLIIVNIPDNDHNPIPVGVEWEFFLQSAATVEFQVATGSTITLNCLDGNTTLDTQYGWVKIKKTDTNTFNLISIPALAANIPFFTSLWDTARAGVSANNQIQLPLVPSGTYNFTVHWGDGTSDVITTWNQAETLHTYASFSTKTVKITGVCTGWSFNNGGDKLKLLAISEWGSLKLGNTNSYFKGCSNLEITATDILDLSGTTDMTSAFQNCSQTDAIPSINNWDFSNVTNATSMLAGCSMLNQDLAFDFSACLSLNSFLHSCSAFNGTLALITSSSLTSLASLLENCSAFNNSFGITDTTGVVTATRMFYGCSSFNLPIGLDLANCNNLANFLANSTAFNSTITLANTDNVTTWNNFIFGCLSYNQPLTLDLTAATTISSFASGCSSLDSAVTLSNTGSVATADFAFYSCISFNQAFTMTTTSLSNCQSMFQNCVLLNSNITFSSGNNITNMVSFLQSASMFNATLSIGGNLSNLTLITNAFADAAAFNQPLAWTLGSLAVANNAFAGALSFDQDIGSWDIRTLLTASGMFAGVTLSNANYNALLVGWSSQSTPQPSVSFSGGNSHYSGAGVAARAVLTGTYGWTITDGGTP